MQSDHPQIQEAEDNESEGYNDNYECDDLDDDQDDGNCPPPDDQEKQRIENEILFAIQGVGQLKTLNDNKVYVKSKHCEASMKDIFRELNREHSIHPNIRLILGQWKFLQNDLMPLLMFHKKDKKLSYLTVKLMVMMTEFNQSNDGPTSSIKVFPWTHPKSQYRFQMIELLRSYKQAFLNPGVIQVLMEHLADCISAENQNQKHQDMIELIICLFK